MAMQGGITSIMVRATHRVCRGWLEGIYPYDATEQDQDDYIQRGEGPESRTV